MVLVWRMRSDRVGIPLSSLGRVNVRRNIEPRMIANSVDE